MVAESIEPVFTITFHNIELSSFHIDATRFPNTSICIVGAYEGYILSFPNTLGPEEDFEKFPELYERLQLLVNRYAQGLM